MEIVYSFGWCVSENRQKHPFERQKLNFWWQNVFFSDIFFSDILSIELWITRASVPIGKQVQMFFYVNEKRKFIECHKKMLNLSFCLPNRNLFSWQANEKWRRKIVKRNLQSHSIVILFWIASCAFVSIALNVSSVSRQPRTRNLFNVQQNTIAWPTKTHKHFGDESASKR